MQQRGYERLTDRLFWCSPALLKPGNKADLMLLHLEAFLEARLQIKAEKMAHRFLPFHDVTER